MAISPGSVVGLVRHVAQQVGVLRIAGAACDQIAVAFRLRRLALQVEGIGRIVLRVDQQQARRAGAAVHGDLQARAGLREQHRDILDIGADQGGVLRVDGVAVHARLAVALAVVDVDAGQGAQRLLIDQVVDGGRHAAEDDDRRLFDGGGDHDVQRHVLRAGAAEVGGIVDLAAQRVRDLGFAGRVFGVGARRR